MHREELRPPARIIQKLPLFNEAVKEGIKPKLAAFSILSTSTELRRTGRYPENSDQRYLDIWHAVESGKAAKEAIRISYRSIAAGNTSAEALGKLAPAVSHEELEKIVKKIIADRKDFIRAKGDSSILARSWACDGRSARVGGRQACQRDLKERD